MTLVASGQFCRNSVDWISLLCQSYSVLTVMWVLGLRAAAHPVVLLRLLHMPCLSALDERVSNMSLHCFTSSLLSWRVWGKSSCCPVVWGALSKNGGGDPGGYGSTTTCYRKKWLDFQCWWKERNLDTLSCIVVSVSAFLKC